MDIHSDKYLERKNNLFMNQNQRFTPGKVLMLYTEF